MLSTNGHNVTYLEFRISVIKSQHGDEKNISTTQIKEN